MSYNKSVINIHEKIFYVQGKNIIYLQVLIDNQTAILTLTNILYCPQFDMNLLNADIIYNKSAQYNSTHNQLHIIYKKYTIFQIKKLGNVYTLNQPEKSSNNQLNIRTMVSKITADIKH